MRIVLTGGTGFIGSRLLSALIAKAHEVTLLTRDPDKTGLGKLWPIAWDGRSPGPWEKTLDGADAVIHLAGEPIAGRRWTAEQKKRIEDSRVLSTQAIVNAIAKAPKKPSVLLNASAVGFYGDVPSGEAPESRAKGEGFLADLCARWEQEALKAEPLGLRVALLRTGIVLGNGGALAQMLPMFRLGLGGPLGSGAQGFPWIHLDDEVGAVLFALENENLSGPINLAAPEPVSMKEFTQALGRALHRPAFMPAPAFALRLALGEMSDMLLTGQKAVPQKLTQAGYRFLYPQLDPALRSLIKN